jgi:hypothetical protein
VFMGACSSLLIPGRRRENEQSAEETEDASFEDVPGGADEVVVSESAPQSNS